jgi:hypothetical protein
MDLRPPGAVSIGGHARSHAGEAATFLHLSNFDINEDEQAHVRFARFSALLVLPD